MENEDREQKQLGRMEPLSSGGAKGSSERKREYE